MASNSTVRMDIEGWDALTARLKEVAGAAYTAEARGILERAAEPIAEEARRIVHKRSHTIEKAIFVSRVKLKGRNKDGEGYACIKIGVRRNVGAGGAMPLEWGHINKDGTVTAPYAFIGPAYDSQKALAYSIIKQGLRDAIFKAGGGGGDD